MSLLKEKIELAVEEAEFKANRSLNTFPAFLKWFTIIGLIIALPLYIAVSSISLSFWQKKIEPSLLKAKPSFENPKPIRTLGVSVTKTGDFIYSAVAELQNENLDLSAKKINYNFNFYTGSNELAYTKQGSFYLLPNQKKYLVIPRLESTGNITGATVEFTNEADIKWQKRLNIPDVKLIVSAPRLSRQTDPPAFFIEGSVQNTSPYLIKKINLIFLVYDAKGNIIATSAREDQSFTPGEKRDYKQLWPGVSSSNAVSAEVIAETNSLDDSNLSLPSASSGSASDLGR